jgi:hypothetical protein
MKENPEGRPDRLTECCHQTPTRRKCDTPLRKRCYSSTNSSSRNSGTQICRKLLVTPNNRLLHNTFRSSDRLVRLPTSAGEGVFPELGITGDIKF